MIKWIKFVEKMWLMVGIMTIIIATYKAFTSTAEDSLFFVIFSAVAFLLHYLRKRQRINMEKNNSK